MAPATSPARSSASVSTSTPLHLDEPTPTDLLLSTPPAILKLLTLTAPVIQAAHTLAALLTWTHPSFFASLLVLLTWWTICLFGTFIFKYLLNALLLLYVVTQYFLSASSRVAPGNGTLLSSRRRPAPATLTPAAYTHLLSQSQDLATHVHLLRTSLFHPLLSQTSFVSLHPGQPTPAYRTAWFAVTSYPFYLLITYLVPVSFLCLVLGSIGILWNAPFFTTLRRAMRKSAAIRWSGRMLMCLLQGGRGLKREWERTKSGVGFPGLLGRGSVQGGGGGEGFVEEKPVKVLVGSGGELGKDGSKNGVEGEGEDVQLLFTCMENQRWWVGLDWTHALLPGERASWTDPELNPSSPPASFTLPPPSITYSPSPTRTDQNARLKRTTEWKWLDPEWKVMPSSSVTNPSISVPVYSNPPNSSYTSSSTSPSTTSAGAVPASPSKSFTAQLTASVQATPLGQFAAGVGKDHGLGGGGGSGGGGGGGGQVPMSTVTMEWPNPMPKGDAAFFRDWIVDEEGWQYGDNAFERMGPKGGLGKYTRRRAWVRRAGLVERAEIVPGDKTSTTSITSTTSTSQPPSGSISTSAKVSSTVSTSTGTTVGGIGGVGIGMSSMLGRVGSLRQRSISGSRERDAAAAGAGPGAVGKERGSEMKKKGSSTTSS